MDEKNDHVLDKFMYMKKHSFISFFINNSIDTPVCFKKIKSLQRKNFELSLLKFANFLMKDGKREQILKILFKTISLFFKQINFYKFNFQYTELIKQLSDDNKINKKSNTLNLQSEFLDFNLKNKLNDNISIKKYLN
jgi:hypothetical protein